MLNIKRTMRYAILRHQTFTLDKHVDSTVGYNAIRELGKTLYFNKRQEGHFDLLNFPTAFFQLGLHLHILYAFVANAVI